LGPWLCLLNAYAISILHILKSLEEFAT